MSRTFVVTGTSVTVDLGDPAATGAEIAFLLSDEAGFITGQTVHADGGASIGRAAF
jgi:3-oxoacyl-[acyl-carrier protein] reductase